MQLTKDDFDQIRKIVRQEIENETQAVKDELQGDIARFKLFLREDFSELKNRIKNFEIRITENQKEGI